MLYHVFLQKSQNIDGARVESVCNRVSITLNKNSVPGDKSALVPGGIRMGAPALTSRQFKEDHFITVVDFVDRAVQIAKEVQAKTKNLKEYNSYLDQNQDVVDKCKQLEKEVQEFVSKFPMPGFEDH